MSDLGHLSLPEFQDIYNHELYKYLNPVDIINTLGSHELFIKCLLFQINERLKVIMGDKYDRFKQLLSEHNLVISGSFIVQVIFGEDWKSDLDIFTADDMSTWFSVGPNVDMFDKLYEKNNSDDRYNYLNNLEIAGINNYISNGTSIQVINLNKDLVCVKSKNEFIDSSWSYIINNFDFDICSNIYYIQDGVEKVRMLSLDNILAKRIDLMKINVFSRKERMDKYLKRGFMFNYKIDDNLWKYTNRRGARCTSVTKRFYLCNSKINSYSCDIEHGLYHVIYNHDIHSRHLTTIKYNPIHWPQGINRDSYVNFDKIN